MHEPPASTFEPTPPTSRRWRAGARRSAPSSSRSASGSGSRPRTHSEHRPRSVNDRVSLDRLWRDRSSKRAVRATLAALSFCGLRDRLDELTGLLLVLPQGDVGLGNDPDDPSFLDNGQPPNIVAAYALELRSE